MSPSLGLMFAVFGVELLVTCGPEEPGFLDVPDGGPTTISPDVDHAAAPLDAGEEPAAPSDAGSAADAALPAADAGGPFDSGGSEPDAGEPLDASGTPLDASAVEDSDAGGVPEASDADTEPADADTEPLDAGEPPDAACAPEDAGPLPDASGPFDAGAAPPDAGGWGTCTVQGTAGICLDVADCDGVSTPGYCPGPVNIQCCTPEVEPSTCDPDVRPVPNEGLGEAAGEGGCPDGMVAVADFCIDRYEATLLEVGDGTLASWSPFFNPGTVRVMAVPVAGAVPQGYISGLQAAEACAERGKRLCTDTEWLRACQGPAGLTYPYGNTRQPGLCNDHRDVHPVVELFGTSASWIWSELDHPCINQLPASVDLTGARPGCVTVEDVYDMMGNLHEWTADPNGTFRGGYYVDTVINGSGCLYRTTAHNSAHWDYSTGFRCCAD